MKLVFLLWLLYFLQGIPYGFQTKFLPVFLRSYSLSLTLISFTRLLSLPWLLKPFWAPLVDKYGSKVLWVKYNLFGMAACYLIASCMSLSSALSTVLVASLNIMAATQDIAVDSLFVNYLTTDDIGLGNIAQVVGYKTGSLFGGGFLGWLSSSYPWQWLFFLLFVMYILSALLLCSPVFMNLMFPQIMKDIGKTLPGNEKIPIDKSTKHIQLHSNYTNVSEACKNVNKNGPDVVTDQMKNKEYSTLGLNTIKERRYYQDTVQAGKMQSVLNKDCGSSSGNFVQAKLKGYFNVYENVLKADGTKWTIVYVLIYKLGEQGMIAILPMFLLDQGMSSSDVAMLTGILCQFCSIFGSLLAGMLFYWDGLQTTLAILSTIRFMTACVLTWLGFFNSLTTNWIGFVVSDCLLHLVSGMITTLTFTLMIACSQKCPRILSATHYSTLATFEVLGKLCMVSVSGTVVDMIGYTKFFVICTCLTLLPVILLRTGNVSFQQEKVQVKD